MIRSFASRFCKDRTASAAAEMALMLPVLFALIFTTYEGGHYMWSEHKVLKGVRDGARYAARLPFTNFDCTDTDLVGADAATRMTEIKNLTRTGMISGGTPKVPGWADDDITVSVQCNATYNTGLYSGIAGGAPTVTVATVVEYPSILGLLGFDTSGAVVRGQANAAVTGL